MATSLRKFLAVYLLIAMAVFIPTVQLASIKEVTPENYRELESLENSALVIFTVSWCDYCQKVRTDLEKLASSIDVSLFYV